MMVSQNRFRHGAGPFDSDDQCFLYVLSHLLDSGVECPGQAACAQFPQCGKVSALASFAQRKFAAEERMMQDLLYPQADRHAAHHRQFLAQLGTLSRLQSCEGTRERLNDLIGNWLSPHLERHDEPLGGWLALNRPPGRGAGTGMGIGAG